MERRREGFADCGHGIGESTGLVAIGGCFDWIRTSMGRNLVKERAKTIKENLKRVIPTPTGGKSILLGSASQI